jgi:hypothetical protein
MTLEGLVMKNSPRLMVTKDCLITRRETMRTIESSLQWGGNCNEEWIALYFRGIAALWRVSHSPHCRMALWIFHRPGNTYNFMNPGLGGDE